MSFLLERCNELLPPESDVNADWLDSLVVIHTVALVSSDRKLIRNIQIRETASSIVGTIIESYTPYHWTRTNSTMMRKVSAVFLSKNELYRKKYVWLGYSLLQYYSNE
jgi:hypothetical protein